MTGAFLGLYLTITFAMFAVAMTTLCWMLDAWRTPDAPAASGFDEPTEPKLSFSLIVPARHEEVVLAHTVEKLLRQSHHDYDVLVVVGHDDEATHRVADELAGRHDRCAWSSTSTR